MNYREWQRKLQEWHSPEEFRDKLHDLCAEHGRNLLTAPRAGFFRDADPACRFALLRAASKVRLVAARRPDFEIDVAKGAREFEVTEADTPGRRRSDEVKGRREPDAGWPTPDIAEQILRESAARKSDGRYEPGWGLLILLNQWNIGVDQRAIEGRMADATAVAKDRFAEVWVLWQDTAYNTWLGGAPGNRVLHQSGRVENQEASTTGTSLGEILTCRAIAPP